MTTYIGNLVSSYDQIFNNLSDKRVQDWPLMGSPFPMLGLLALYLYTVVVWGPRYMSTRKAYNLKGLIAVYNVGQVTACCVLFYQVLTTGWTDRYSLGCQQPDYSNDPMAIKMAGLVWWTMMLKVSELIETVFFVLRKKNNQVSFLHLYHHSSTLFLGWVGCKYVAGGMATFPIMPNSLVHILMYTYYLLALLGPEMQRRLNRWKRYLTILQMVQFLILVCHAMQALRADCNVPKFIAYMYIPNVFLVFYLFYDFYTKTYMTKPSKED